ncbi:EF-hand domain-containing protein [Kitasatospora purpeofusca]|uniref:EF-hand domain-containing protein n=1 Tax=Kitasatospora purpeofusca TaxID=67352 RepID=UPI002E11FD53|nr:EF-hand domain-containing protein [Kitasatospora purpeofusca]
MPDVLDRKLKRAFALFQGEDKSAPVDRAYFAGLAHHQAATFPGTPAAKIEDLEASFTTFWDRYLVHRAAADGTLTGEGFSSAIASALETDRTAFLSDIGNVAQCWYAVADSNDDHVIDRDEYTKLYGVLFPLTADELATGFAKMDRDGNGVISHDEVRAASLEYWTSNDPEARGNWLFGPFE